MARSEPLVSVSRPSGNWSPAVMNLVGPTGRLRTQETPENREDVLVVRLGLGPATVLLCVKKRGGSKPPPYGIRWAHRLGSSLEPDITNDSLKNP